MYGKYIENILKFDRNKDESFLYKKGVVMKILPVVALIAVFGLSGCNTFADTATRRTDSARNQTV